MTEHVIIIGAGQAGAQTAISLRQMRFDGRITLLGDERYPPYQRPPLSKKVMTGEMDLERTYIRSEAYYAKSSIDLQQGVQVTGIDRAARTVTCADGTILDYDYCVICTGTRARRLDLPGGDLPGVLYLRTLEDSERIKSAVGAGARAVIIGGGYIGLEIAASLTKWQCEVTVLEALERVLNRVVALPVSDFFAAEHARQGVSIVTEAEVAAIEGTGKVERVRCADGRVFPADIVVIGVGAVPNDELAREAGLDIENGIVVDDVGRTSDPAIFAAGDVTNHPNDLFDRRLRLESVHNAMAQGKAVAGAIVGKAQPYAEVPWFWSDQYDLKLQIAGVTDPDAEHLLRGDPGARTFSCLHLRDGRLVAIDAVNRGADFLAAKNMIRDGVALDRDKAVDLGIKLTDAV